MRHLLLFLLLVFSGGNADARAPSNPVQLSIDTSEADQALRILVLESEHRQATEPDWHLLFASEPYQRLKDRETSIGRVFTDDDFKAFLLSSDAVSHIGEWQDALHEIKRARLDALGASALAWLPAGAKIHARVYALIKPIKNSFVWAKEGAEPAIFLYLGKKTKAQFENTIAHECHHIGLRSLEVQQQAMRAGLSSSVALTVEWMTGFGEGEAMLAAAGSTDKHPHWEDDALVRARWDSDLMHFNRDVATLEQFFTDILDGKLVNEAEIFQRAAPFWGEQGAWYTVGYEMSVLVEKRFGHEVFLSCLIDPRKLLALYNAIAVEAKSQGADLAIWSPQLMGRLGSVNQPGG